MESDRMGFQPLLTDSMWRIIVSLKPTPGLGSCGSCGPFFWVGLLVSFHQGHLDCLLDEASVSLPLTRNHLAEVDHDSLFSGTTFCFSTLLSCPFPSSVILDSPPLYNSLYFVISTFSPHAQPLVIGRHPPSCLRVLSILWVLLWSGSWDDVDLNSVAGFLWVTHLEYVHLHRCLK